MREKQQGTVRIIGGKWRSRKLTFPALQGVRPTQDHIRETIFNWLMFDVEGATCLDLYAGSGGNGFEALSRGAKQVTFVDSSTEVCAALRRNAEILQAEHYEIVRGECPNQVPALAQAPFDIIFCDPPFHKNLINPSLQWIEQNHYLKPGGVIYFEQEKGTEALVVPATWEQVKHKSTSSLDYYLYQAVATQE